jgi:two-component system, NtrC family, sensor histidine kinase HydH
MPIDGPFRVDLSRRVHADPAGRHADSACATREAFQGARAQPVRNLLAYGGRGARLPVAFPCDMGATPRDATTSLRRVRWGQALVYSAIGLALVATAVQSWVTVGRVSSDVAAGQGRRLLHVLRRSFHAGRPVTPDRLARQLRLHEELGLRCIATRDDATVTSAGECHMSPDSMRRALAEAPPGTLLDLGPTAAMIGRPPPWRPGYRGPPVHDRAVLIEFEPAEANALERTVRRSLIVALAAVLALIAATVVLWRLSRRAEVLQADAERDRRLITLGEMSAVLAHEIRNPLAALKGHAQLLMERLEDGGAGREKVERVVTEAKRLERLTEDLLRFVRSPQVEPSPVDPAALLSDAVEAVDPARITVTAGAAPPSWRLDAARMRQVLVNLLRNAVEASPEGTPAEAVVEHENGALVFRVRDHGSGLPAGEPERVFEPFYTTRAQGTGLGLAVARRIVEQHRGTLTARTHESGGAEFRVVIP